MFEDSLIESGNRFKAKRRLSTTILSFFGQFALIGVLILIPLIYTDALPKTQLMTFLVAPPPPPPPPPPPAAAPVKVVKMVSEVVNGQLRTPTKIPQKVQMIKEEEAPPDLGSGGVPGGVPGGIPGGSTGRRNWRHPEFDAGRRSQGRNPAACSRIDRRCDRSFDQESSARISTAGKTGPYSGACAVAGGDQQGRHDSEPAVNQRTPDAGAGGN